MTSEQELAALRAENAKLKTHLQDCVNMLSKANKVIAETSKVIEQVVKGKVYIKEGKRHVKIAKEE